MTQTNYFFLDAEEGGLLASAVDFYLCNKEDHNAEDTDSLLSLLVRLEDYVEEQDPSLQNRGLAAREENILRVNFLPKNG